MRRIISFTIVFTLILSLPVSIAFAHKDPIQHYEELEAVLFDNRKYKKSAFINEDQKRCILILEYASNISIDQFGDTNNTLLKGLQKWVFFGIPASLEDINPNVKKGETQLSPKNHRTYTHQGWDYDYSLETHGDLARWQKRKNILLSSVNKVFSFSILSGTVGFITNKYPEKCNSLAALIYYIHIIGDYLEDVNITDGNADRFNCVSNGKKCPFAKGNPDLFSELQKHISILFADQSSTRVYMDLMNELNDLATRSRDFMQKNGGMITNDQLEEARNLVTELMDILAGENKSGTDHTNYIHKMLIKEDWFTKVFPYS